MKIKVTLQSTIWAVLFLSQRSSDQLHLIILKTGQVGYKK